MSRSRVFVTRPIAAAALNRLAACVEMDLWDGALPPPPEVVRERVRGCDGLLCLLTERIDASVLAAALSLKVVSNMAVGVDNVDVAACTARRIPVGHTPGVLTEATADFAFALLLGAARRLVEGDAYARSGQWKTWEPGLLLGKEVHGATLGIAGFGAIGQAVARRALAFGMRVLAFAALDVTDPEPPAPNEPLLGLKNVLLAPHLGSATVETRTRMAMLAVDNLLAVLEGRRPAHVVNPEVL